MSKTKQQIAFIMMWILIVSIIIAQGQTPARRNATRSSEVDVNKLLAKLNRPNRASFSLMPSFTVTRMAVGTNLQVLGGGTSGRLTKWTGFTSSNSFIGDSAISEDKIGNIGIGTDTPTSKLTVVGIIQSTSGGFKFPDGTVQTSSATGALFSVAHDITLTGSGFAGSPLGVNVPLVLSGAVHSTGPPIPNSIIEVTNTEFHGDGLVANAGPGGQGVEAQGGSSLFGGHGVFAVGGDGSSVGGAGIRAFGGDSNGGFGGMGIEAVGGSGGAGGIAGLAGRFVGVVEIDGKLVVTSGMKMFHIDHPLDPENKYLNHVAIESSEVLNIYSGNVITDAEGNAVVDLPEWFEVLNKDVRYQLTVVGTFAQAIIAKKIKDNRFTIKSSEPNLEVSWQVTGVRSDPTTRKYKFEVEEEKGERERGSYLNPDAYGQPEEKSIRWARDPEGMRQRKQRIEAERKLRQQPNQQ